MPFKELCQFFMPGLMGVIADRWISGERLLGLCHLLAGGFMILASLYGISVGSQLESALFVHPLHFERGFFICQLWH